MQHTNTTLVTSQQHKAKKDWKLGILTGGFYHIPGEKMRMQTRAEAVKKEGRGVSYWDDWIGKS